MVDLLMLFAGALLIVERRTPRILIAYVVLAATASIFILPSALESPLALALFALSSLVKLVVVPVGILLFLRANPAASDLRPSIGLPARIVLVVAFASIARAVGHSAALAPVPMQGMVAYVVLCSVGMLIVHRNLLAQVMGLLALGAGITLAGATLAPALPESVELGATFDALVATFIGLALVRAFVAENPVLDVESLRRLRG